MDFREHQRQAKKNSRKIWFLYILLLLISSALTGGLFAGFFLEGVGGSLVLFSDKFFQAGLVFSVLALIVLLISTGIGFFRNSSGKKVAEQFGGVLLTHEGVKSTLHEDIEAHLNKMIDSGKGDEADRLADLYENGEIEASDILGYSTRSGLRPLKKEEKRALNIIEEQSLAASMPIPPLYIIPDEALNAFAAGNKKGGCVVALTQGSLNTFDRSETSGIIAHELGHIVSEDVNLNIRVAALVFGFTAIYFLGRLALRGAMYGGGRDSKARLIKLGLGLGIIVVGLITVFFGKVLQAAMSRQREFLADASAVQFTRHPDGLISAFNKIKKSSKATTTIDSDNTSEFTHAFIFGIDGEFLATHPPLKERIARISSR